MIKGFEDITAKLSDTERDRYVPLIVDILKCRKGISRAVTSTQISDQLHRDTGWHITGSRIRKIINHIRYNGLVRCLVASSHGYYIAESKEQLDVYIESLQGRLDAIRSVLRIIKAQGRRSFKK